MVLWNIAIFRHFWFRTSCMDYVNCETAKEMPRMWLFEKKLSLFKEVSVFSIIIFKNMFYWYCEILQFSGIFGLETVVWAMWTVKLRKKCPECDYLKKKLSLFKEVAVFSIIIFKNRFYWYCEILQFSGIFGLEPVVWAMWTVKLRKKCPECDYLKKSCRYLKKLQFSL